MKKFKVGDKVRIRKDLKVGDYGAINFIEAMEEYRGKVTCIKGVPIFSGYSLDIDKGHWCWSSEMIEPVKKGDLKKTETIWKDDFIEKESNYEKYGTFLDICGPIRLCGVNRISPLPVEVKKTPIAWTYTSGKYSIGVEKHVDSLTIKNTKVGGNKFVFDHSKPEVIEVMARLFLEACKL